MEESLSVLVLEVDVRNRQDVPGKRVTMSFPRRKEGRHTPSLGIADEAAPAKQLSPDHSCCRWAVIKWHGCPYPCAAL